MLALFCKVNVLKALIALALLVSSSAINAATPATPAASVDARHYAAGLGTGLAVDWANTELGIREFDPLAARDIQQRGFGHVGIKVSGEATPQRLLHLRKIVEACVQYHLVPIIMWEGPTKGLTDGAATRWWSSVAQYFHGEYPQLSFMLLAEGERDTRTATALNRLYDAAIKAVQQADPQRIVIVAPHLHAAPEMLAELHLPANNPHLLVSWHLFALGPQKVNGHTPWAKGSSAERAAIHGRIHAVVRWQQKTGLATLVSAFSPLTANEDNTPAARGLASFVACELNQAKIPFILAGDERYYDGEEGAWRPGMASLVDAVLHPVCPPVAVKSGSQKAAAGSVPAAKAPSAPVPQKNSLLDHNAG